MTSTTDSPMTFGVPAQVWPTWQVDEATPVSAAAAQARTEARSTRRVGLRRLRAVLSPVRWALIVGWILALAAGHVLYAVGQVLLAGVAALSNRPRSAGMSARRHR